MTASPEKLQELLTYCMDFGKLMLSDSGDFYPFGATLGTDGQVSAAGGSTGEDKPASKEIYRLLGKAFASGAADGSIVAAALAANVNIPAEYNPPAPDGIRVHLECSGFSRFIYVPYTLQKQGFFRKSFAVTLFEPIAVQVGQAMFSASSLDA